MLPVYILPPQEMFDIEFHYHGALHEIIISTKRMFNVKNLLDWVRRPRYSLNSQGYLKRKIPLLIKHGLQCS